MRKTNIDQKIVMKYFMQKEHNITDEEFEGIWNTLTETDENEVSQSYDDTKYSDDKRYKRYNIIFAISFFGLGFSLCELLFYIFLFLR